MWWQSYATGRCLPGVDPMALYILDTSGLTYAFYKREKSTKQKSEGKQIEGKEEKAKENYCCAPPAGDVADTIIIHEVDLVHKFPFFPRFYSFGKVMSGQC